MCGEVCSFISSLLKKMDIFKVGVKFNIEKENEYGTPFGGIIFLCYFVACLYFLIANFSDFINRSIYNQNIIDVKSKTTPSLDLFDKKLSFAFGVVVDGEAINDTAIVLNYIGISLQFVTKYPNSTKIKQSLNLTKCEKYHFNNKINESFDSFSLEKYQCIDPSKNDELFLQGIYTDAIFKYIEFSVQVKKEALNETKFLENYFLDHEVKIQLFHLDSSINVSNYRSPESLFLNSQYLTLSFPFVVKANVDFSNNTFEEDANILLSSTSVFHFYTIQLFQETRIYNGLNRLVDKKNDYDLLGRMYIRASQSSVIYKRTYQKLTEYLADSTIIVSQILFLLVIAVGEYDQFKAKEYIIDNMLKYKVKFIKQNPNGYQLLKKLFHPRHEIVDSNQNVLSSMNKSEATSSALGSSFRRNQNTFDTLNKISQNYENKNQFGNVPTVCSQSKSLISDKRIRTNNFIYPQSSFAKDADIGKDSLQSQKQKEEINKLAFSKFDNNVPLYYNYLPLQIKEKNKKNENIITPDKTQNQTENETLVYGFCDMIKVFFSKCGCCKKDQNFINKEILFEKGLESYFYNLNIFSYFTKMREIDILKYVLLTPNQKVLVDFVSKPSISLLINDKESPLSPSLETFDRSEDRIRDFHLSFIKCNNDYLKNKNENQQKLLQLTSYELFQLI